MLLVLCLGIPSDEMKIFEQRVVSPVEQGLSLPTLLKRVNFS